MPKNNNILKRVRLLYSCECPCGWRHNASSKKGQKYMEDFHCRVCVIGKNAKNEATTFLMTTLNMDTNKTKITSKVVVPKP